MKLISLGLLVVAVVDVCITNQLHGVPGECAAPLVYNNSAFVRL